jgi:hypothetical protein
MRRGLLLFMAFLAWCSCDQDRREGLSLDQVTVSRHMVLPVRSTGMYYITGTTDLVNVWEGKTRGFHVYSSPDLENWKKTLAWTPPEGSEWDRRAWGAIILPWRDQYLMLGSVYSEARKSHGILSMVADVPEGPYVLRSGEPIMEGIDPALVIDMDGTPWLVAGGREGIMGAPLTEDLMSLARAPDTLLQASWIPGAAPAGDGRWFHDAPTFHRLENGELVMLFSTNYTFPEGVAYATFKLRSTSGRVAGPWTPAGVFLPGQHGAWIWKRLDGTLMLTVKPEGVAIEKGHPEFIRLLESTDDLTLYPEHASEEVPTSERQGRSIGDFLYIENEQLKLGIDTSMGGAITYLEIKRYGENMVNDFDLGRQVQISFFGGPNPFIPSPTKQPHERWVRIGWNPIQAGDVFGHGSRITELHVGKDSVLVRCIPMHWPLENVPGQCIYESRIRLAGNKVFATARILNRREDHTQYPARSSEFPAIYTNGTYYRLFTYTGEKPFTSDTLTRIPKRWVEPGEFPWTRFQATENWAALVNYDNVGMGVYSPVTQRFLGGFTGTEGEGSTFDIPCGYICPIGFEVLDHNIEYEYSYVLVTGELEQIRKDVYDLALAERRGPPCFEFHHSRQGWYYRHARDTGWPVREMLDIMPGHDRFSLVGPDISFEADDVSRLELSAAMETGSGSFAFLWNRVSGSGRLPPDSVVVDILPGGGFRTYRVDLAGREGFAGLITGIRFSFTDMKSGDRVRINRICFR